MFCYFHKLMFPGFFPKLWKKTLKNTLQQKHVEKTNNAEISVQVEEPAVWKLRKMRNANEINVVFWPMIISMMRSMMPIIFRR